MDMIASGVHILNIARGDYMTDLETYMHDNFDDRIYDVRLLKPCFTPYEQDKQFQDEKCYYDLGDYVFVDVIELPDKDVLIGMRSTWEDYTKDYDTGQVATTRQISDSIEFYKLSSIWFTDVTDNRGVK